MVGVVSLIPILDNFIFADFENPQCQFLYKNARNVSSNYSLCFDSKCYEKGKRA